MSNYPFDLTCWYLNDRRIISLTNYQFRHFQESDFSQKLRFNNEIKNAVVAYMFQTKTEPLDKLIFEKKLNVGSLFTHHTNFFFKGLPKVSKELGANKVISMASGYSKGEDFRLTFNFHHEHLVSNSSWSELSGQKKMFLFGLVQEIRENEIIAIPYVIGNLISNNSIEPISFYRNYGEIHVDSIDNFSALKDYNPKRTKQSLNILKDIPENKIKEALAEILNEPSIPKDWGGESSDLFSSYVSVEGKRISSAFILKGPAKFRPMKMSELGKNGDQISRLYNEPADLLILQHCHEITKDVRVVMRAFANQVGNLRFYCIIDGYDTLRILQAYEKLGLKKLNNYL